MVRVHVLFLFVPPVSTMEQSDLLLYNNEIPKPHHFIKNLIKNRLVFVCLISRGRARDVLDCKEIQPVHPEGDQLWMFIGRTDAEAETPILWPPHAKRPHWKKP